MSEVIPPRRKISVPVEDKKVDYALLKSMIRDEVDLQVNRKLAEVIKPLYQVMMQDSHNALSMQDLPDWAIDLLELSVQKGEDIPGIPFDTNDEDYWGL
ncbi:MAG: hypothetical protein DRQ39_04040 [Gammaproteobacteria bacterium]|nr:MAG: hypothetical protein DRQ39_04040 [Gammaproteobacteria bacterium]